eukprot:1990466-Alexandrium_andersonii.AAC.1
MDSSECLASKGGKARHTPYRHTGQWSWSRVVRIGCTPIAHWVVHRESTREALWSRSHVRTRMRSVHWRWPRCTWDRT